MTCSIFCVEANSVPCFVWTSYKLNCFRQAADMLMTISLCLLMTCPGLKPVLFVLQIDHNRLDPQQLAHLHLIQDLLSSNHLSILETSSTFEPKTLNSALGLRLPNSIQDRRAWALHSQPDLQESPRHSPNLLNNLVLQEADLKKIGNKTQLFCNNNNNKKNNR
jgi:hypothetical protein